MIGVVCRTTKQRLSRQSKNAASCLISDSESSDDNPSLNAESVDVDDDDPAKIDLISCNSSFSDCSLPCHELVTCSEACEPLPEGLVKVRVRPPQCVEPCVYCGPCGPCVCVPSTDRDRYDIKFVSHIIDRPQRAKICKTTPPPFIPPPPEPSSVEVIPPAPSSIVPSISEETIVTPTIISEPPPIVEEIPSPPPPPPPPSISIPSIVEPGVFGVSGTQVVTRYRKHYGDLCKLIRCRKPCPPRCQPCPIPCDAPPSPCDCCTPYEPCNHTVPCYPCNNNQSNSSSSRPSCEPCCLSSSCCDPCDPCTQSCEPCFAACCKPPHPPCRPCCKVTWVRSITTKPLRFSNPLILNEIMDAEDEYECESDDESYASIDIEQIQTSRRRPTQSKSKYPRCRNNNVNAKPRRRNSAAENTNESHRSGSVAKTEKAVESQTVTKHDDSTPKHAKKSSGSEIINVGYKGHKAEVLEKCSACPDRNVKKGYGSQVITKKPPPQCPQDECPQSEPCKPTDPCKWPPPDMDQQTLERYMEEMVNTLMPVIPPNPFAVPRESCVNAEPDCDRIRVELERLLAAVDDCPGSTLPFTSCSTVFRSGCWPC